MLAKVYQVGFYKGGHGDKDTQEEISTWLTEWAEGESAPAIDIGSYTYKVKNLVAHRGSLLQGVFAKFRHDDLPKIGGIDDTERPIDLDDEEGLIEKNHFLYDRNKELLVYQQNGHGSTVGQFAEYITEATDTTSVFNPVLQPDAMKRLLKGGVKPVKMTLSCSRPENTSLLKGHAFTKNLMKTMTDSGAYNINMTMSLGRNRSDYLAMDVANAMNELFDYTEVRVARFDVEDEEGIAHPIDLISDRIKASINVGMDGRYPKEDEMFSELRKARVANNPLLNQILG